MKHLLLFYFLVFGLLSCSEDSSIKESQKSEIIIDSNIITNGLSFSSNEGQCSISFTVNDDWNLSIANTASGSLWCIASEYSGSKGKVTVTFSVTENTAYENRSVAVTIKSGTITKTFTITQKNADALLLTNDKFEIGKNGGIIEIEVKSNIDYEIEILENAKEWIEDLSSRSLVSHKHRFNISTSDEAKIREGHICFKSGDKKEYVRIYQSGEPALLLSQKEYYLDKNDTIISVDIKSNFKYGVIMPDVDWIIDLSSSRGMSSHTLKYQVIANDNYENREAQIVFYDKDSSLSDTLRIYQSGEPALLLSQKEYYLDKNDTIISVDIKSNFEYGVIMPDVDWIIDLSSSRGMSSRTLKYQVIANNNYENREAQIVFYDKDSLLSDTLRIYQQGNIEMIPLIGNLSIHPAGVALQYTGVSSFSDFFEAKYDKEICKAIYSKFEDVFDFILFLYNTSGEEFSYGGFSYPVNIDIKGIGCENINTSASYGSSGKLKGINHLTLRTSIFSAGPFLHELAHYWGAAFIGQEHATVHGSYETPIHWGTSDINGILGGFDYSTLERNVDGNPNKYRASCDRAKEWGYDGFSQELSSGYFAPLELYLMGLLPSSDVPDMHVFKDVKIENETWGDGTFYANSEITYTIEDFITRYGVRQPDYQSSQKDFRALVVVVTDKPVSREHWSLIQSDILKQEKQGEVNDKYQSNFWEATGGRATLTLSGIDKFLK